MARALILFLLWPSLVLAATIRSTQDGNWSDGSTWAGGVVPGKTDDVQIIDGDTVTVDLSMVEADRGDTTCRILHVNKSGMLYFDSTQSGNTIAVCQLWGGGCGTAGFISDSASAGSVWVFGGDTLFVWNDDLCPPSEDAQDIYFSGTSGWIRFEGTSASNRACLEGLPLNEGGNMYPTWWIYSGDGAYTVSLKWARFHRLGNVGSVTESGLQWERNLTDITVENCLFDSANISGTSFQDWTFYRDSFLTYNGSQAGLRISSGNRDTMYESHFIVDHNNSSIGHTNGPLDLLNNDSAVVIYSTFLSSDNFTGGGGPFAAQTAVNLAGSTFSKVIYCRADSFVNAVVWSAMTSDTVAFDTFVVMGLDVFDHTNWASGGKSNVFAGNYIYKTLLPDGADDIFNVFCTQAATGDSLDVKIYFNTVDPQGSAIPLAFRESASLGYKRRGVHVVGNIFAGSGNDLEVNTKDTVVFRNWSSNAFDQRSLGASAALDSSLIPAGSANISASAFGFVDSANGDLRLTTVSPMLGAVTDDSDSLICASLFNSPNYNIGAYQGAGVQVIFYDLPVAPTTLQSTTLAPGNDQ